MKSQWLQRGMNIAVRGLVYSLLIGWSISAAAQQDANSAGAQSAEGAYQRVLDRLMQLTPTAAIDLQMETEKLNYQMEAALELRFSVDRDGYVLLMRIAPDGVITFPILTQPVLSGQVYSTAGIAGTTSPDTIAQSLGLDLQAGTKMGSDVFNLVYSPEKLDWLSANFAHDPPYTITPTDEERLQRLLAGLDQLSQTRWSGTSVALTIGPLLKSAVPRKNGAIPPIRATGTTGKEAMPRDEQPRRKKLWNVSPEN